MKKVLRILLAISLLSLTGCDFLRTVAGRPTSDEIAAKKERISAYRKARMDAKFKKMNEIHPAAEVELTKIVEDETKAVIELSSLGCNTSSVFRFGQPLRKLEYKYNLIVGVFRNRSVADAHYKKAESLGFSPFYVQFEGDVNAVCLCGSNSMADIVSVLKKADRSVCPKDAWVYVNEAL